VGEISVSSQVFPKGFFVANLFRINCPVIRNSKSDRCDILFYARSETPLSWWCWFLHPCPCGIGQFQGFP
jgi:hypothetical protein